MIDGATRAGTYSAAASIASAAHHPVGGVLAARDRDQTGDGHRDGVLARQLGGLLALARQQRPQPGVDAVDVVVGQRGGQHGVDRLEDVVDVGLGGRRVGQVEVPVGVGGADDPVRAPRDDEQHRLLGAQDDRHLADDAVARHDDVHALGRTHPKSAALLGQRLDLVGPHSGGVDDDVAADVGHLRRSRSRATRTPITRSPSRSSATTCVDVRTTAP